MGFRQSTLRVQRASFRVVYLVVLVCELTSTSKEKRSAQVSRAAQFEHNRAAGQTLAQCSSTNCQWPLSIQQCFHSFLVFVDDLQITHNKQTLRKQHLCSAQICLSLRNCCISEKVYFSLHHKVYSISVEIKICS